MRVAEETTHNDEVFNLSVKHPNISYCSVRYCIVELQNNNKFVVKKTCGRMFNSLWDN